MIKILHVTPGLESGGAEMLLSNLVRCMDRDRFENSVVSLTDEGPILGRKIKEQSVPLIALGFPRGVPNPMLVWRLAECIKQRKPDIVQTWLYHANAVGSLAAALTPRRPVVWGLHKAKFDLNDFSLGTRGVIMANTSLSRRFPTRIVCSSDASMSAHADLGYPPEKLRVIANGVDTGEFRPDVDARMEVRRELGLGPDTPLIGMVARYTKEKDHPTFFRAASILHARMPEVRFVLCGSGMIRDNVDVRRLVVDAGIESVVHLMGLTSKPAYYTAALDVATCTSSAGESFCMALAEAMACGVPCVTTDLEGPAALVGEYGKVAPRGNAEAIADAWALMLTVDPAERAGIGIGARHRIVDSYSLASMVRGYEDLYAEIGGNI